MTIRKKVMTDENHYPVAVQIDYRDWLKIENALQIPQDGRRSTNLARHVGKFAWPVDGLEYQDEVRGRQ